METDFMEKMAREYTRELRSTPVLGSDGLLRAAQDIVERQLDLLVYWQSSCRPQNRALSYLESLKIASLREIRGLLGEINVPQYRERPRQETNIFNRLVDLQVELFTDLDRLVQNGADIQNLINLENRAASILALVR